MKTSFLTVVICLSVALCGKVFCSPATQPPQKIAVLPFTKGGQENIDYIADGLKDMIASRIASGSDLVVIEQGIIKAQFPGAGKETLPPEKLMNIGKALGADYLIYGSIAKMGGALIIAVNMLSMSGGGAAVPVFTQTLGLDEVIPRMQLLAQEVRDGIANGLQTPKAAPASIPSSGEPEAKGEEGIAGGTADPGDTLNTDVPLPPDGSAETPGSVQTGEAESENSSEATGEK